MHLCACNSKFSGVFVSYKVIAIRKAKHETISNEKQHTHKTFIYPHKLHAISEVYGEEVSTLCMIVCACTHTHTRMHTCAHTIIFKSPLSFHALWIMYIVFKK